MNRDPIEEKGGLCLNGFLGNDSLNAIDLMGMWTFYDVFSSDETGMGEIGIQGVLNHFKLEGGFRQLADMLLPPDVWTLKYKVGRWVAYVNTTGTVPLIPGSNSPDPYVSTEGFPPRKRPATLCGCVTVKFENKGLVPVGKIKTKIVNLLHLQKYEDNLVIDATYTAKFSVSDCLENTSPRNLVISPNPEITVEGEASLVTNTFADKFIAQYLGYLQIKGRPLIDDNGVNLEFKLIEPSKYSASVIIPLPFPKR